MKINALLLIAGICIITACTNAPESDQAKTSEAKEVSANTGNETWQVKTEASKVEWVGTKVTGYHTGDVPMKGGEIFLNDEQVVGGKFILDLAGMAVSGPKGVNAASNERLLGHLKSSDFFDVEKYPEATFELVNIKPFEGSVSDTIDPRQEEISKYKVANPTHTVNGNLTIKDITKNIEFPARITVDGNNAEAIAKFNIDRTHWDITYPGKPDDLIRNEIHLGVAIKASK